MASTDLDFQVSYLHHQLEYFTEATAIYGLDANYEHEIASVKLQIAAAEYERAISSMKLQSTAIPSSSCKLGNNNKTFRSMADEINNSYPENEKQSWEDIVSSNRLDIEAYKGCETFVQFLFIANDRKTIRLELLPMAYIRNKEERALSVFPKIHATDRWKVEPQL